LHLNTLLKKIDQAGFELKKASDPTALTFWDHVELHIATSSPEKALCHLVKSEIHTQKGELTRTVDELKLALTLLELPSDLKLFFEVHHQLFKVLHTSNQFDECLRICETTQIIALEHGVIDEYVYAALGMAVLCTNAEHYQQALKFFKHIDLLDAAISSRELRLRYKLHKVHCLLELQQFSDASALLKECKELSILVNDKNLKAYLFFYKGRLYRMQQRNQLAQHRLSQAIEFTKGKRDVWLTSMIRLELAHLFFARGHNDLTELCLSGAAKRTRDLNSLPISRAVNHHLSSVYAAQNKFELALARHKIAYSKDIQLIKAIPISELSTAQVERLQHNEAKLRLIVSEQENRELKAETQTQKSHVARLQQDVYTDPLTQLNNRRWLDIKLKDLLLNTTPFALLIIDIDHFKSINDELSHMVGDKAITQVSQQLKQQFKFKGSSTVRFGGEEFLVILEHTELKKAQLYADHFRQRIADYDWEKVLGERALTVSIGVTLHHEGENTQRTFYRADKALYEAKANGRNQVCFDL
jgi:diguanylate cyclase (GGDEF)-like protein